MHNFAPLHQVKNIRYTTGSTNVTEYIDYTPLTGKPDREKSYIIVRSGSTFTYYVVTCIIFPFGAPEGSNT
jgi:hypothetical protein